MKLTTYPTLVIALVFGLIIAALFGRFFYSLETKTINLEFQKDVTEHTLAIEKELIFNSEALYALKGFYDNSENVTKDEFEHFTLTVLQRHPSIQALSWVPKVNHQARQYYEQDYQPITERNKANQLVTASQRAHYFPVSLIEPLAGNQAALGFDLASNPKRLLALQAAQKTAKLIATASITLVQESNTQKGFLAILPIYSQAENTVEQNSSESSLIGYVTAVFRIGDLINSALSHTVEKDIKLTITDNSATPPAILHTKQANAKKHLTIHFNKPIEPIGTRQWQAQAAPSIDYVASRRSSTPTLIFLLVLMFISSSLIYIFIILRQSKTTEKAVRDRTAELTETKQALERISLLDDLTGIANRRHFDNYLMQEWNRAWRNRQALTLIIIDIDYFKQFNDNYGHLAGDVCLQRVAQGLAESVNRASDLLARYGGEEFTIVVPDTADGYILAELCRNHIEKIAIPHAYSTVADHITVSIGFSALLPSDENKPDDLFKMADEALYKAKTAGRNQSQSV